MENTIEKPTDVKTEEKLIEEKVEKPPQEEKTIIEEPQIIKKPNKARKRKKKQRDGPKFPLTGYVRFVNDHRENVRIKNPNLNAIEITKMIADEWNKMAEELKKPYLEAAEIDKERYSREIEEYKKENEIKRLAAAELEASSIAETTPIEVPQTHQPPSQQTQHQQQQQQVNIDQVTLEKEDKCTDKPMINGKEITKEIKTGDYDIQIFTDEFLDHNKIIDSQLRTLRKSHTDYEQQNAVLEKHVENMRNGIDKLDNEINSLKDNNTILQNYIDKLKEKLTNSLSELPLIPNYTNGAQINNILDYMTDIHSTTNLTTLNKAKDIIRKLDLY